MLNNIGKREVCWAVNYGNEKLTSLSHGIQGLTNHWSRKFEYPWILLNGNFTSSQWVLDAAGGDAPLQIILAFNGMKVVNIDASNKLNDNYPNIYNITGDITRLPYPDNCFDRVICASVLEHIDKSLHTYIFSQLWRVLAPGGRLLTTFDVTTTSRYNHNIDDHVASNNLALFNLELPDKPNNRLTATLDEINPQEGESHKAIIDGVLCFWCDKV